MFNRDCSPGVPWALFPTRLCAGLVCATLVACATTEPLGNVAPAVTQDIATVPQVVHPEDEAGRLLLLWHDTLRQTSAEGLSNLASKLGSEVPSAANTVHLALVLLTIHAPGDAARALGLLESLQNTSDPEAPAWAAWARLLAARASEQKRLEDQLTRQTTQLRDNQRKIDQLNEQLDALKAIERSLAPRNAAPKNP